MHQIRAAAKDNTIFVSLGYSKVDLNSLYTTQVLIDPTGNVVNHRRKSRCYTRRTSRFQRRYWEHHLYGS